MAAQPPINDADALVSEKLKDLIQRGKEKKYITINQLNDELPSGIDDDSFKRVWRLLTDVGIAVVEVAPPDGVMMEGDLSVNPDDITDELRHEFNAIDPVRAYMREMGSVDLLTRAGEISIAKRIEEHRILVAKIENKIAFQIEVGVMLSVGCQVGSTYIPSQFRGQGLSTQYMRGTCKYLLEQTQSVNLYVHTDNIPAQRCYQKTGFRKIAKYRLVKYQ